MSGSGLVLLGRLRIRGKLSLLVAIPLLAVVGLVTPIAVNQVQQARQAAAVVRLTGVANQVGVLLQALQQERLLSVAYLLDLVDQDRLAGATIGVRDQIDEILATQGGELPPSAVQQLRGMGSLAPLRAAVLARRTTPEAVITQYGALITGTIDSLRLLFHADLTTPTGRQVYALDLVLRLNEGINLGSVILTYAAATGSPWAVTEFTADYVNSAALDATFGEYATPAQAALYAAVPDALNTRLGADFVTTFQTNPGKALAGVSRQAMFDATEAVNNVGRFAEQKLTADVIQQVTAQQRRQTVAAYATVGLALLLILIVVLLSATVVRAVSRPLARLTRSAERMATIAEDELVRVSDDESETVQPVRLDRVDTGGRDEIGELARAFERVQATAAGLVERQVAGRRNVAQMFGHVGRRTQNLVGRQLALIDRLERAETDPSRLSDLYRLDHVSNRLRRSAGSLVVLSGGTSGDDHMAPLPLGDVVRLALGEIEDYTRVLVDIPPSLMLVPAAISDLVLVFAELMENATMFSPPHTSVSLYATAIPYGTEVSIVDHGIGLTPERLAEENARLTRRERLDLAPTEVLGLFVVGRLARRHGLRVTLGHTPGGGVTAHVEIPDGLLAMPPGPVLMLDADAGPLPGSPGAFGDRGGAGRAVGRV
ncbi:MAG TPA: nitrate- and nitrite sensing domain-containing protein, partial [Rugosimonospora sp.]|nr:nitrate- and nitrite sensing domain-containing protein [Rugosimonospora sp.]